MYLNKVMLYGNLTRDPELRALPSGQQVATFGLATNRSFKNKEGQQQEQTEFHNIVAFGRTAEVMGQYLKKGRPVFIDGRIQTRSWEKDGQKNYRTEIVVDNFQFGPQAGGGDGSRGGNSGGESSGASSRPASIAPEKSGGDDDFGGTGDAIQYPDDEINPEDIPF
ncbi:MAG TPA: single-stranded DNA-binding protein [Candidatus Paceibacterota bacterium]|jgi:single-strand DNA-binding protein|nr:single-stranded DNA-binding protein [Candidatus Paceibacterota bacterium]